MTGPQSDRLDMMKATSQFIEDTTVISSTRAGLVTGKDNLKIVIAKIEEKAAKQTTETKGAYQDKSALQEELAQKIFIVTSGTAAYAASIGNNTLQQQVNYSITDLRLLKDDVIGPFATNIISIVTPLIGAPLAAYGIAAPELDAVKDARDAYLNQVSKPRELTTEVAAQTAALAPLFSEGRNICRNILDKTAATLKPTQVDWYNQYTNVRKIVNTRTGSGTTLEGEVEELGTNTPIYNAKVTISQIGQQDIVVFTDVNGHYKIIPIKRGTYSIKITHADYNDVIIAAFEIKQGQSISKNVVMEKK